MSVKTAVINSLRDFARLKLLRYSARSPGSSPLEQDRGDSHRGTESTETFFGRGHRGAERAEKVALVDEFSVISVPLWLSIFASLRLPRQRVGHLTPGASGCHGARRSLRIAAGAGRPSGRGRLT